MELVHFVGIQLLNALWLSALLFMLAVGLSVVFGLLDVLNLAHCTLYMIGAYIGFTIASWALLCLLQYEPRQANPLYVFGLPLIAIAARGARRRWGRPAS